MEIWKKIKSDILSFLFIFVIMSMIINAIPFFRDSTDTGEWFTDRSQMRLHTDELTGCQYLSIRGGGITPRLGRDGKVICLAR